MSWEWPGKTRLLAAGVAGIALALACGLDETGTATSSDASLGGSGGIGGSGGSVGGNAGWPGTGAAPTGGGTGGTGAMGGVAGTGATGASGGVAGQDAGDGEAGAGGDADLDAEAEADAPTPVKPTDFAGLVLWLRADLGVSTTGPSEVQTWADQSGGGKDYSQASNTLRPVLAASAINGKPAVRFSPQSGLPKMLEGTGLTVPAGFTFFAVVQFTVPPTATTYFDVFDNAVPGAKLRLGFTQDPVYKDCYFGAGDFGSVRASLPPADTTPHLYEFAWTGGNPATPASYAFVHDGTLQPISASGAQAGNPSLSAIGTAMSASDLTALKGDVGEIIVYDHVLTSSEHAQLSQAVRGFWGIP